MIACATSVLVAAFARWHDQHAVGAAAIERVDALIDHVAIETFSVLTRLPPPRRAPAALVAQFLRHHFPAATPRLRSPAADDVLLAAEQYGIAGGATYDLMVALAAHRSEATLVSLDRRAVPTYEAAGAQYDLLGAGTALA